ncbi:MAG: hypothetical protein Q7K03_09455 [Dehalococcoidia bacterium]|nr:hypothetical protein [Dehalococcoidia bacterium]
MQDIITMADMGMIFDVTDDLGIDRESIRVELTKEDPGSVRRGAGGLLEIVVPLTSPLEAWLPTLKTELQRLGFG